VQAAGGFGGGGGGGGDGNHSRAHGLIAGLGAGAGPGTMDVEAAAVARRLVQATELVRGVTFAEVAAAGGDVAAMATIVSDRLTRQSVEAELAAVAGKIVGSIFDVRQPPAAFIEEPGVALA
jgi:hypothetical protein